MRQLISKDAAERFATLVVKEGFRFVAELGRQEKSLCQIREWCRDALIEFHLVNVAAFLWTQRKFSMSDLEVIGIPVDVLECFPNWREGYRNGFRVQNNHCRLTGKGCGAPVGDLRIQLSPSIQTVPYALVLLRVLLRRMDRSVNFLVITEPGANLSWLQEIICQFDATARQRVRLVESNSITVFSRDNAVAALDQANRPVLLTPRSFRSGQARFEDEIPEKNGRRNFGLDVKRTHFYWEGGNILYDGLHCFVGVDTIAENQARMGLTEDEVCSGLSADFGVDIVPLGNMDKAQYDPARNHVSTSGQAAFHIDLDLGLLGKYGRNRLPRAVISDPARGLDYLPDVFAKHSLFRGHFVPPSQARRFIQAEYEAYACERHPALLGYCEKLEDLGYRVLGVPDLRIDPKENLFATVNLNFGYSNLVPGLWHGRPAAHYFSWGIQALDVETEACFRAAQIEPVCIHSPRAANELMKLSGGLRCFCGELT